MALGKKKRRGPPPRPETPRIPLAAAIRMFVIGTLAVFAAAWALFRHYSVPRMPMLVPAPSATEIPAPELEVEP